MKMEPKTERLRLDEILTRQGKLSETQLKVALIFQKIYGGKLASHILHHGYMNESELVDALSEHFACPGVVLANQDIPKSTLELIPKNVVIARRVIPFAYDVNQNLLSVACENPADKSLIMELTRITGNANIKLFVAVETSLNLAIGRHYGYSNAAVKEASESMDTSDVVTESIGQEIISHKTVSRNAKAILITIQNADAAVLLKRLFEKGQHDVLVIESIDDLIDLIAIKEFDYVFIHELLLGNNLNIINRIREKYPQTEIRIFSSVADMLMDKKGFRNEVALQQNLELFASLLTIKERLPNNYNAKFSRYVERVCDRLPLSIEEKTLVINAAYLYDRAKFYYLSAEPRDFQTLIMLATKLLQSVFYEPAVIEIIRCMYIDLRKKTGKQESLELLGGNILTVVDMFCDAVPPNRRITLNRFDAIKAKYKTLVGFRLLETVVKAFISLMQEEVINSPESTRIGQIMIYSDQPDQTMALDHRLRSERFRTIVAKSLDSFYLLYNRSKPDILVMYLSGGPREIIALINEIIANGVDIKKNPTVLMVDNVAIPSLTSLCERGIEDVIDREASFDFVLLKINKILTQWEIMSAVPREDELKRLGSHGSLSDLNLIDLLQALGPSQRSTKIIVTPSGSSKDQLEIFLDQGNIIFAQLGNLQGPEAIYAGMTWGSGNWTIEPIERKDLMQSNNDLSNESILMEGCRLIDEMNQKL